MPHATRNLADASRRQLGRIGSGALGPVAGATRPQLTQVRATAQPRMFLPLGAQTRRVDADGRIKFATCELSLSVMFEWQAGRLDQACIDGWLTLTQSADGIGARRDRCGVGARFTVAGAVEHIGLRPAQLAALGMAAGGYVLVTPAPDAKAVLIVNPAVCLAGHRLGSRTSFQTTNKELNAA